jgi:hypothetical protein
MRGTHCSSVKELEEIELRKELISFPILWALKEE